MSAAKRWGKPLTALLLILLGWEWAGLVWAFPAYLLTPWQIIQAWASSLDGEMAGAVGATALRAGSGFLLGAAIALPIATLAAVLSVVEDVLEPFVGFLYSLPKISLFPIFVVWLGYSDSARITMIAVTAFFPVYVYMHAGVKGINPGYLKVAANVGANRLRTFLQVIVPAAAPMAMVGIRVGVAISLIVTFATEVIGQSPDGLGRNIQDAFNVLSYEGMYTSIVMFAMLGVAADWLLRVVTCNSANMWGETGVA
jgi:ABC-type nitrate/sulfonate/bicarbonate transport system permease component